MVDILEHESSSLKVSLKQLCSYMAAADEISEGSIGPPGEAKVSVKGIGVHREGEIVGIVCIDGARPATKGAFLVPDEQVIAFEAEDRGKTADPFLLVAIPEAQHICKKIIVKALEGFHDTLRHQDQFIVHLHLAISWGFRHRVASSKCMGAHKRGHPEAVSESSDGEYGSREACAGEAFTERYMMRSASGHRTGARAGGHSKHGASRS